MGSRGPIPKRSDKRRRTNKPAVPVRKIPMSPAAQPPLDLEDVHPIPATLYAAIAEGPEAAYYSAAMWQRARWTCLLLSRLLSSPRPSAQMYAALQADLRALLVDAGELRRLGIELEPTPSTVDDNVIDWRARATEPTSERNR